MTTYAAGTKVRMSNDTGFTDASGVLVDPTTVALVYRIGSGAAVTQTYNPGAVVRTGVGLYYFDLDTTGLAGTVEYYWISTGTGQSVSWPLSAFVIQARPF